VRPYYRDALAAIVPLRSGGGTRLKILEAMAAGVPVISTELGAEGLAVTPGKDILVADPDDSEAWIRHLTCVSESAGLRKQLVTSGRHLVQTRYDWEILGETLATTYQDWLQNVP
jgi:glycosyltransferase involved in cell wall biosynthesis